jgi:hypothetical protein
VFGLCSAEALAEVQPLQDENEKEPVSFFKAGNFATFRHRSATRASVVKP